MNTSKSKTELLLEAIQPKEYIFFERYLIAKLGKCRINYFDYWLWYKENMIKIEKGKTASVKPYKHVLTRNFLSDFNKLIESYFVGVSVERDEQLRKIFMLSEMRKRKKNRLFNDYLKEVKIFDKNRALKGFTNSIISLKSYFEEYMTLNALNDEKGMSKISNDICKITEIVYFQNELFNFINLKLFVSKVYEPIMSVDIIMEKIEENTAFYKKYHTNVYVLYLISKLIREFKKTNDLVKVVSYLHNHEKKFSPEFLKFAIESLIRLVMFKTNTGDLDSLRAAFRLLKDMERKGTLKKLPHIQPLVFFSGFSLSLRLEDLDFAEKLIKNYSHKLASVPHDDVLAICRAMVDYEKGKMHAAKDFLIELKIKNVTLYLYAKATLLKVLYDKNELRRIVSITDSVKHFLQRKEEIPEAYRQNIFKFLTYITKLALAKRKNGWGLPQIRERFDLEKTFFQKNWILNKLIALEEIYIK